jgi:hypothetical protein
MGTMSVAIVDREAFQSTIGEELGGEWELICLTGEGRFWLGPSRHSLFGCSPRLGLDERLSCPVEEGKLYQHPHEIACGKLSEDETACVRGLVLRAGLTELFEWPTPQIWVCQTDTLVFEIT